MLKIDHTLLSADALDNLLLDIITRQATDYGDVELDFTTKKKQLMQKLTEKEVVVVYDAKAEGCGIILSKDWQMMQEQ